MSTAALTQPDVARAVTDLAYYDAQVKQLDGAEHAAFVDAVIAAHRAAPLSDTERAILDFARDRLPHFRTKGALEQAIRYEFDGISATRYYQRLNALLDRPEAAEAYPGLVNRLRRQRAQRQARRSNHTVAQRSAA